MKSLTVIMLALILLGCKTTEDKFYNDGEIYSIKNSSNNILLLKSSAWGDTLIHIDTLQPNKDYDICSYSRNTSVYFYSSIIFKSNEIESVLLSNSKDSILYRWVGENGDYAINHNNGGTDSFLLDSSSNDTNFYLLEIK